MITMKRLLAAAGFLMVGAISSTGAATGSPSRSTLIGWSADGAIFATLEQREEPEIAVEIKQVKNGRASLVMAILPDSEGCLMYQKSKPPMGCKVVRLRRGVSVHQAMRRIGVKHHHLRPFKLLSVKGAWRASYKALGLRFERSGERTFKHRGRALSWRVRLPDKRILGYVRRGDDDHGSSIIVGGYRQKNQPTVLLKVKDFNDGYRHQEYYVVVDLSAPRGRVVH